MAIPEQIEHITVTKEQGISPEVKAFLESIEWGSEGAVYQRHDMSERLYSLPDPYLILLRDEDRIAGTAIFNKRTGNTHGKELPFYYVCFFASSPHIRGKGLIKKYGAQFMTKIREDETDPAVYMGVIERGNHGSFKVSQNAGYEVISHLQTIGFSRYFPKQDARFRKARPDEYGLLRDLLHERYSDHALVHFTHLFMRGDYYVLEEQGQLLAGAQAHPARWEIQRMPGFSGKLIMNVLPHVPLIRRLYNPKDFRFLSFEGLFYPPGRIDILHRLLESILAHKNCHTAMLFLDERSPLYSALIDYGRLGLVRQFTKDANARIVASFEHMDAALEKQLRTLPWYTTGFDYI